MVEHGSRPEATTAESSASRWRAPTTRGWFVAAIVAVAVALGVYAFVNVLNEDGSEDSEDANQAAETGGDPGAPVTEPVDDKGLSLLGNGMEMTGQMAAPVELDAATQAQLDAQLERTREVARRLATVADAEAAGYRRAGPFTPGLGAHYVRDGSETLNADGVVDDTDIDNPLSVIYDGTDRDSRIVGFMYLSLDAEPEGFAGPNDMWHIHTNVCTVPGADGALDTPLGADKEVTREQCSEVGGTLMEATPPMVHVWSIAGYESPRGMFSSINPAITCSDGTYYTVPEEDITKYLLDTCRADAA